MTQPRLITDGEWARMPWHARQEFNSQLSRERDRLLAELDRLHDAVTDIQSHLQQLTRIVWPDESLWSSDDALRAHNAYTRGERDAWAVTGHRIYDKRRKRTTRRAS